MIANPKKLQAIITDRKNQKNYPQLTIDENVITSSENVTLLGLEVDSKRNLMNIYLNYVTKMHFAE